jgi:predicted RNase H-like nuclease
MRVLGVDGCRGGWLAAAVDGPEVRWLWSPAIADLLAEPALAVGIDIPVGLPDAGVRACDVEARRLLGRRAVTVFAAPVRPVLDCTSYADARAVLAARGGASMSAQAFGIVPAVRQVDAALSPADDERVVEAHPELAFLRLAGRPLDGKRTAAGVTQRLAALTPRWPNVRHLVARAPAPAAIDDALDALACATTAERWAHGEAVVLGDATRDARDLPMRIAY